MKKLFVSVLIGLMFPLSFAAAVQGEDELVSEIEISGIMRIEPETVLTYLMIRKGDHVSAEQLDRGLKSLFSTGLFADVRLSIKNGVLKVELAENPIVSRIVFEGNKKIKTQQLEDELTLRTRSVFTRSKVRRDTQRILELYKRMGRYSARVEPKIIERSQNRLDVVFEINEGNPTFIRKIDFIGNKSFSASELEEEMLSKENRWYRWFTSMDSYDPDRFAYDQELLRRFYLRHGYLDFNIISSSAELSPNREDFYLTLVLEEGPRYKVGEINVLSELKGLDAETVADAVTVKPGTWYNNIKVENSELALINAVGAKGFPFVDVSSELKRREGENIVDVTFLIKEGQHLFIDEIQIMGNGRTQDRVIRREFRFAEGDAYSPTKIRRSKQRIENLNYFDRVMMDIEQAEDAVDRAILKTEVSEKSTGSLKLGIGWSSYDGPLAEVSLQENNFLGTGRRIGASASVAEKKTLFDISFVEPWFLDRELSLGFDIFYLTRNYSSRSSYDSEMVGASVSLSWKYTEELSHTVKYTLRQDRIFDISEGASIYVKEQEGKTITSMVSQTLFWDYLDNRYNPSEGYYVSFSNDLAGFGGDTRYLRTDVSTGYYIPLSDKWVLGLSSSAGYIVGIGQKVRLNNRYFLGGSTLRGFEDGGVTARSKVGNDALGGNWQATAGLQLMFPLGLPSEFGMRGKIFSDFGVIGKPSDFNESEMWYSSKLRGSIGIGFVWSSPLGPINVDYARPILKERFDETEYFRLNFGWGF
ncbi:MAG: outer membrane protein assembly factor BamA [Alphaproteobacteria bacterium]|nr:outer membrane protein assembly factor BamA [Alphaproteobacteria bacterium]